MNDLYWRTVLQQEGIPEDNQSKGPMDKLSTKITSYLDTVTAGNESRLGKVILEPSVRLQTLKRVQTQLSAVIADAEANVPQISSIAEQLESCAYKKSNDLDDYLQNVTLLVDGFLFDDRSPYEIKKPKASLSTQLLGKKVVERTDVIHVLRSYQVPFNELLLDFGARLREVENSGQGWTGEEKELPIVYKQMTMLHQLLLSVLGSPGTTPELGLTTEMLVSMEKQIDYWLSLGKKLPMPCRRDRKPILDTLPPRNGRVTSCVKDISPQTRNSASPSKPAFGSLPSLFCAQPMASATLPRFGDNTRSTRTPTFHGLQLPPFNPQKSLPLKGSQPLLSSERSLGCIFSQQPKVSRREFESSPELAVEEDELDVITNLTALQREEPGRESCPGSTESSPRASLSKRGRKAARSYSLDQVMDRSDNEHAFILSKLAEVMGKQASLGLSTGGVERRAKRTQSEMNERKDKNRDLHHNKRRPSNKRARTRQYEFEAFCPNSVGRVGS